MASAEQSLINCEQEGHILVITLQREHKRNAVDRDLAHALDAALNRLDDNAELRVGILTGGQRYFCAGSDLNAGGDYVTERGGEYGLVRRLRRKPLIAAVEGMALGGGMEIVLACDMVVAASNAYFGLPEVARGVIPTCGGLFRTLQALPPNIARELVLGGQAIDATRAHALGLVNTLTAPGASLEQAFVLARQIAANAPLSVQACLKAMNPTAGSSDAPGWEATALALASIRGSHDAKEGVRAFLEKRAPVWRNA